MIKNMYVVLLFGILFGIVLAMPFNSGSNVIVSGDGGGGCCNPFDQDLNTTDDVDFNTVNLPNGNSYLINDITVLRYNSTTGSIYLGENTGLNDVKDLNTFIGKKAGYNFAGGTGKTTAIGESSGASSSGNQCVHIGSNAGGSSSANYQVNIGAVAGKLNAGSQSVGVGYRALEGNDNNYAVGIGTYAGYSNSGSGSVMTGAYSGYQNSGAFSTFNGHYSGYGNSGGYTYSTGFESALGNSGSGSICLGYEAGENNIISYLFEVKQNVSRDIPLMRGFFDRNLFALFYDDPANALDVNGSLCVGENYVGTEAPTNGAMIEGVTLINKTRATGGYDLEVEGDIVCRSVDETSDIRVKTFIAELPSPAVKEFCEAISIWLFSWNNYSYITEDYEECEDINNYFYIDENESYWENRTECRIKSRVVGIDFGETTEDYDIGIPAQPLFNYIKNTFGEVFAHAIVHVPDNESVELWDVNYKSISLIFARYSQIIAQELEDLESRFDSLEEWCIGFGYVPPE